LETDGAVEDSVEVLGVVIPVEMTETVLSPELVTKTSPLEES
jgi:hypothetical protein